MKRVLSILLVAALAVSAFVVVSTSIMAAPVGTAVATDADFAAMTAGGQYYLTADITVPTTYASEFSGTFDGNGHKVTISQPLFAKVSGTVKNLTVEGSVAFATTPDNAGAVAKVANSATFTNVTNNASVTGYTTTYLEGESVRMATAGGIVGTATGSCTFTNITNTGAINGYNTGGIVGIVGFSADGSTSFESCSNSGALTTNNTNIIGKTGDPLRFYLKSGNYLGVGGIVGLICEQGNVSFKNCSNSGSIDTTTVTVTDHNPYAPAGGIYGVATYPDVLTTIPTMSVSFDNCSNTAAIKGIRQTGGLAGWMGTATFTANNCTNAGTVESTTSYAGGLFGRASEISYTITNCKNLATGIVISKVDQIGGIVGYSLPSLSAEIIGCTNYADLTATVDTVKNVGGMIGSNGNNKESEKFSIIDCRNEGNLTSTLMAAGQVGGLVANCGTKSNATFINCFNKGTLVASGIAGGIIGQKNSNAGLTIKDCINEGNVTTTTDLVGGILGYMTQTDTLIVNCINKGDIYSTSGVAGGITGRLSQFVAEYYNCINYGNVESVEKVAAGIAGHNAGSDTTEPQIFDSCGNEGNVKSTKEYAGGILGYIATNAVKTLEIRNCYVTGTITSGEKYSSGLVGYMNTSKDYSIEYNYVNATLSSATNNYTYAFVYNNNASAVAVNMVHNYIIKDTANFIRYKTDENIAFPDDYAYYYEAADLASGKLAYTINTAAGKNVFYQTLGTDTYPVTDNTHKIVLLNNDKYVNAITYEITASAGTGGTITPNGVQSVNATENLTFTIAANSGYKIKDVLVDGASVGAVASYKFEAVVAAHKIEAVFEEISTATTPPPVTTETPVTTVEPVTTVANTTAVPTTTIGSDDGGCDCGDSNAATIIIGLATIITSFGLFIVIKKK